MGNVMISLDDEYEAILRKLAQEKYGGKKGSISETVSEALKKLQEESRERYADEFKALLLKGLHFKYKIYRQRAEIYE